MNLDSFILNNCIFRSVCAVSKHVNIPGMFQTHPAPIEFLDWTNQSYSITILERNRNSEEAQCHSVSAKYPDRPTLGGLPQ